MSHAKTIVFRHSTKRGKETRITIIVTKAMNTRNAQKQAWRAMNPGRKEWYRYPVEWMEFRIELGEPIFVKRREKVLTVDVLGQKAFTVPHFHKGYH